MRRREGFFRFQFVDFAANDFLQNISGNGVRMSQDKPWAGRFTQPTDKFVEEFTASIDFDKRMYRYDIQGSIAHCRMLAKQRIIAPEEAETIIKGLDGILADIEAGNFEFKVSLEDIHMNVEARLIE